MDTTITQRISNGVSFIKNNQQRIAFAIGYLLVALLFFALGRYTAVRTEEPQSHAEPPQVSGQVNNSPNAAGTQRVATTTDPVLPSDCQGQIKGNISSSGKIYHVPGGAFYKRVNPEVCFKTEAEARAAGFRKSQR